MLPTAEKTLSPFFFIFFSFSVFFCAKYIVFRPMVHVFGAIVIAHKGLDGLEQTIDAFHVGSLLELFKHKLLDVVVELSLGEGLSILQQYLAGQQTVSHICTVCY